MDVYPFSMKTPRNRGPIAIPRVWWAFEWIFKIERQVVPIANFWWEHKSDLKLRTSEKKMKNCPVLENFI